MTELKRVQCTARGTVLAAPPADGVGLPLHNIHSSGVLMKSIEAEFNTRCPSWRKPHVWDAVSNSSKYCILSRTQLIHFYKFVCIIPIQNSNVIYIINRPLVTSYDIPG